MCQIFKTWLSENLQKEFFYLKQCKTTKFWQCLWKIGWKKLFSTDHRWTIIFWVTEQSNIQNFKNNHNCFLFPYLSKEECRIQARKWFAYKWLWPSALTTGLINLGIWKGGIGQPFQEWWWIFKNYDDGSTLLKLLNECTVR